MAVAGTSAAAAAVTYLSTYYHLLLVLLKYALWEKRLAGAAHSRGAPAAVAHFAVVEELGALRDSVNRGSRWRGIGDAANLAEARG